MPESWLLFALYILTALRLVLHFKPQLLPDKFHRTVSDNVDSVVQAGVVALFLIHFIVRSYYIPSGSMLNTLQLYDYILVNKLAYTFGPPSRGDIAVFHPPDEAFRKDKTDLIKRIVAIEGDVVEVKEGALYVNGKRMQEPYTREGYTAGVFPPHIIPKGHVFVMGDNRQNSRDARYFGPVPVQNLVGKAFFIFWPPHRIGILR